MNILSEDVESLEYLMSNGQWTKHVAKGKSFAATEAAFEVARKASIHNFKIVCYISQTKQFINLDHGKGQGGVSIPRLTNASAAHG